jgi:uncharacterized protein
MTSRTISSRPVPCPRCRKSAAPRVDNEFFPFCSNRCRLVDLGAWLTEEHRIPGAPADVADENPRGGHAEPPDDPPLLH